MKISYDLEHPPERITRRDSEEIIALKGFLADGKKSNMVIEYDDVNTAKKRYGSLRDFRKNNGLQGVFDMYRADKALCIIKAKKGAVPKREARG